MTNNKRIIRPRKSGLKHSGLGGSESAALDRYIRSHVYGGVRGNTLILTLIFMDPFLLIPAAGQPAAPLYLWLLVPPVAVMNGWALMLALFPERLKLNFLLFRAVFGLVVPLGLLTAAQKFAYEWIGLRTPLYAILSFGLYALALGWYWRRRIRSGRGLAGLDEEAELQTPRTSGSRKPLPEEAAQGNWNWIGSGRKRGRSPAARRTRNPDSTSRRSLPWAAFAGLGSLAGNALLGLTSPSAAGVVLACIYSGLSFVLFHFTAEWELYLKWKRKE